VNLHDFCISLGLWLVKGLDNHYVVLPGLNQAGLEESEVLFTEFMLLTRSIFRANFLPNGMHNPGELRESQLAFLSTRWDMPCRIDLSRIFRANNGANGSLQSLRWA
jgi:hypothetical protein